MAWELLGSITPAGVWQSLPTETNSTLFKIEQQWNNQFPGLGSIKFAFNFDSFIFESGATSISLSTDNFQIIRLAYPQAIETLGFATRKLAIKFGEETRILASYPWSIHIEQWTGLDEDDGSIDGGIY